MSAYAIKGEENTLSIYERKEKARDGYVYIYELGKLLRTSKYKRTCTSQEKTISKMKEIVDMYKYEIEEIHSINRDR